MLSNYPKPYRISTLYTLLSARHIKNSVKRNTDPDRSLDASCVGTKKSLMTWVIITQFYSK